MLTISFYATNGSIHHGVVIGRSDTMLEVAFDSRDNSPAHISWVNPKGQIGKMELSIESFPARHKAIKEALAGNANVARQTLYQEEKQRLIERSNSSD